jgi:prepilin-type N-terminal cleavage/methylation domain-containing protein
MRGFTLIEILLAVAVLVVIAGSTIGLSWTTVRVTALDRATEEVVELLRSAHWQAMLGVLDQPHGVYRQGSVITHYVGPSFANRLSTHDRIVTLPVEITATGAAEIIFAVRTGRIGAPAGITLERPGSNPRTITVNIGGIVDW